jgi:hypothetical protein
MPSIIDRNRSPAQRVVVPARMALAMKPEIERGVIPSRVTLGQNAPPFAGELREEQCTAKPLTCPNGGQITLATLRRPWNYVGWAVRPGNAGGAGLSVQLRILTRGVNGLTAPVAVAAGIPFAVVGIIMGATCELVISNTTGAPVSGLVGALWGMSER